jgi:hypothetical protein
MPPIPPLTAHLLPYAVSHKNTNDLTGTRDHHGDKFGCEWWEGSRGKWRLERYM